MVSSSLKYYMHGEELGYLRRHHVCHRRKKCLQFWCFRPLENCSHWFFLQRKNHYLKFKNEIHSWNKFKTSSDFHSTVLSKFFYDFLYWNYRISAPTLPLMCAPAQTEWVCLPLRIFEVLLHDYRAVAMGLVLPPMLGWLKLLFSSAPM